MNPTHTRNTRPFVQKTDGPLPRELWYALDLLHESCFGRPLDALVYYVQEEVIDHFYVMDGDFMIASLQVVVDDEQRLWMHRLMVDPGCQQRGVGYSIGAVAVSIYGAQAPLLAATDHEFMDNGLEILGFELINERSAPTLDAPERPERGEDALSPSEEQLNQ